MWKSCIRLRSLARVAKLDRVRPAMLMPTTEDDAKKNIAANIKQLLLKKGWTAYRLHIEASLPMKTNYRIVNGESMPDILTAMAIAKAFGVDIEDLLRGQKKSGQPA